MNICPVCGYGRLRRPPEDYLICPSCGTEFGYDDFAETDSERVARWHELRARWIGRDMPWFSRAEQPPLGWNPLDQVMQPGFAVKTTSPAAVTTVGTAGAIWKRSSKELSRVA